MISASWRREQHVVNVLLGGGNEHLFAGFRSPTSYAPIVMYRWNAGATGVPPAMATASSQAAIFLATAGGPRRPSGRRS